VAQEGAGAISSNRVCFRVGSPANLSGKLLVLIYYTVNQITYSLLFSKVITTGLSLHISQNLTKHIPSEVSVDSVRESLTKQMIRHCISSSSITEFGRSSLQQNKVES
jgi:uncharacterized membrane protein